MYDNAGLIYNFKSSCVTAPSEALVTWAAYITKRFMCFWV